MKLVVILGVFGLATSNVDEEDLAALRNNPAAHQSVAYKISTKGKKEILTTNNGAPVDYRDTNSLNENNLLRNAYALDSILSIAHERIPERVVHAKGAGAFGYFEVTHDITKYCKAKLFEHIGKKTPLVLRFSTSIQETGGTDLAREPRGYAVKFYTEDGNWDIVGINTPVYFYKDGQYFVGLIHALKRNPVTGLQDFNAQFDFLLGRPESLHNFLRIFSDIGIPDGYRHMSGFSIHTYELVNKHGDSHFARLHFIPDQGVKNIRTQQALQIGAMDPDYASRDLFNFIANGSFPSWTMYIEVMTKEQVEKADFDPFDVTLLWPKDRYPLLPVGKIVLNKNPSNYFAEVEQLAMNPGHLVPGIPGPPDRMFQFRILSYRDTQNYRLGINHYKIPVNCPLKGHNYNRDGVSPVHDNGDGAPNYYPNTFNGPLPFIEENRSKFRYVVLHSNIADFSQSSYFYEMLTEDEKVRLTENLVLNLSRTVPSLQKRMVEFLKIVNSDLSNRIAISLRNVTLT